MADMRENPYDKIDFIKPQADGNLVSPIDLRLLAQHTGVHIARDAPEMKLFTQTEVLGFAPPEMLPVQLVFEDGQLLRVTGVAELIGSLRHQLLAISSVNHRYTESRDRPERKVREVWLHENGFTQLFDQIPNIAEKYIRSRIRIQLLQQALQKSSAETSEHSKEDELLEKLSHWEELTDSILLQIVSSEKTQELLERESKRQTGEQAQREVDRLVKLLTGERASTVEQGKRLRERVLRVLTAQTQAERNVEMYQDLNNTLLEIARIVNDIRLIELLKTESKLDLLDIKQKIKLIKAGYVSMIQEMGAEKNDQLMEQIKNLNNHLLVDYFVQIANTIKDNFQHVDKDSSTLLSAALYQKEAVCAGKVELLVEIAKILGLTAKSQLVARTMDDRPHHAVAVVTLLGGTQLVIDANYNSNVKSSKEEIENSHSPEKARLSFENSIAIAQTHPESEVLIYITEDTTDVTSDGQDLDYHYVEITAEGERKVKKTDVPHPHKVLISEADATFSSVARINTVALVMLHWQELGFLDLSSAHWYCCHLLTTIIEENPQSYAAHQALARLLESDEKTFSRTYSATEKAQFISKLYKTSIEINPWNSDALSRYGAFIMKSWIKLDLSQTEAAIQAKQLYDQALIVDKWNLHCREHLIKLLKKHWQTLGFPSKSSVVDEIGQHFGALLAQKTGEFYIWYLCDYASYCEDFLGNFPLALTKYKGCLDSMESRHEVSCWLTKDELKQKIAALTQKIEQQSSSD